MFKFLLCASILVGCGRKIKRMKDYRQVDNFELQESVARLTMIPEAPFGFVVDRVVYDSDAQNNTQIQYRCNKKRTIDLKSLQSSYLSDMEFLGWNCVTQFCTHDEMILLFERPGGSLCQVSYDVHAGLRVTMLSK